MTLISVKSQYGSCNGNCTGILKINNKPLKNNSKKKITVKKKNTRKIPFAGMTGWAVNSIANAIRGSIPFLPNI